MATCCGSSLSDDVGASNFDATKFGQAAPSNDLVGAPWLCKYEIYGCSDPKADNYASWVTGSYAKKYICQYGGCNDTLAENFNKNATYNDGTCVYGNMGCTVRVAIK